MRSDARHPARRSRSSPPSRHSCQRQPPVAESVCSLVVRRLNRIGIPARFRASRFTHTRSARSRVVIWLSATSPAASGAATLAGWAATTRPTLAIWLVLTFHDDELDRSLPQHRERSCSAVATRSVRRRRDGAVVGGPANSSGTGASNYARRRRGSFAEPHRSGRRSETERIGVPERRSETVTPPADITSPPHKEPHRRREDQKRNHPRFQVRPDRTPWRGQYRVSTRE